MESWHMLLGRCCKIYKRARRIYRKQFAVIRTGLIAAAVFLFAIIGVSGGDRNLISKNVHAASVNSNGMGEVHAAESAETEELQAGLMGVVNGAVSVKTFSRAANEIDMAGKNEKILVGASFVSRHEHTRRYINRAADSASKIFAGARQVIRDHQMPESEYYNLLRIVEAEATGDDIKGKMLIANVILNRVKDERFPGTIEEVVWQQEDGNAQFQPTIDGRIYTVEITDDTIEAVDRALQGEDASQGALFFMARSSSEEGSVSWFDENLIPLFSYRGHEYYTLSPEAKVS